MLQQIIFREFHDCWGPSTRPAEVIILYLITETCTLIRNVQSWISISGLIRAYLKGPVLAKIKPIKFRSFWFLWSSKDCVWGRKLCSIPPLYGTAMGLTVHWDVFSIERFTFSSESHFHIRSIINTKNCMVLNQDLQLLCQWVTYIFETCMYQIGLSISRYPVLTNQNWDQGQKPRSEHPIWLMSYL